MRETGIVAGRCTCGAQLYEDSLFCHRCGKPQRELTPVEESHEPPPLPQQPLYVPDPSMRPVPVSDVGFGDRNALRTAMLAAAITTLLMTVRLPLDAFFKIVWLLSAGFLAVYLYQKRTGQPVTLRTGVRLGWLTGLFCFMILLVLMVASAVAVWNSAAFAEELRRQLQASAQPGVDIEDLMRFIESPTGMGVMMLSILVVAFLFFTGLPMLGGALGAKVLEKE